MKLSQHNSLLWFYLSLSLSLSLWKTNWRKSHPITFSAQPGMCGTPLSRSHVFFSYLFLDRDVMLLRLWVIASWLEGQDLPQLKINIRRIIYCQNNWTGEKLRFSRREHFMHPSWMLVGSTFSYPIAMQLTIIACRENKICNHNLPSVL